MSRKKPKNYMQRTDLKHMDSDLPEFVNLGMRQESLRLARLSLKQPKITPQGFKEAVEAILIQADGLKSWTELIEAAYNRLPKKFRPSVRTAMLCFYHGSRNYEKAVHFRPRRFTNPLDLVFSFDTLLELRRMDEAHGLALKLFRIGPNEVPPVLMGKIMECLAEYMARNGDWEPALAFWNESQNYEPFHRSSLPAIVQAHVARALLAVAAGLKSVAALRKNFDSELEITLPRNADKLCDETERELRRWERKLHRILPAKRWEDFKHLKI